MKGDGRQEAHGDLILYWRKMEYGNLLYRLLELRSSVTCLDFVGYIQAHGNWGYDAVGRMLAYYSLYVNCLQ